MNIIVNETSNYAAQIIEVCDLKRSVKLKTWTPITMKEMNSFLITIISIGLIDISIINIYCLCFAILINF